MESTPPTPPVDNVKELIITNPYARSYRFGNDNKDVEEFKRKRLADNVAIFQKLFEGTDVILEPTNYGTIIGTKGAKQDFSGNTFHFKYGDTYILISYDGLQGRRGSGKVKIQLAYDKPVDVKKFKGRVDDLLAAITEKLEKENNKKNGREYYEAEVRKYLKLAKELGHSFTGSWEEGNFSIRPTESEKSWETNVSVCFMKGREPQVTFRRNILVSSVTTEQSFTDLERELAIIATYRETARQILKVYEDNKDSLLQ